jgi:hypothetical protein
MTRHGGDCRTDWVGLRKERGGAAALRRRSRSTLNLSHLQYRFLASLFPCTIDFGVQAAWES